ncbi:MAG: HlyD family efflux transporter periplasmic adaptor subunit, partial [Planctomycetota bacterium]
MRGALSVHLTYGRPMSVHDSRQQTSGQRAQGGPGVHLPVLSLIDSLREVCRPHTSRQRFVEEMLRGFVGLSSALYGAFWVARPDEGALDREAELAPGVSEEGANGWQDALRELAAGVVQQAIMRSRTVGEPAGELMTGQDCAALGFPVRSGQAEPGCITIVVRQDNPILSEAGLAMLRILADFGLLYVAARSAARFEGAYQSLSGAWGVVGEALAFAKPVEMAQVMVERARTAFGAQRVSVGFVRRGKVAVTAVSGEDILDRRSNFVRLIQAAQTEVLVSGEPGLYSASAEPEERAGQVARNPQHERLARASGADAVYSVPLRKEGDLVGVWTLEFSDATPLSAEARQVVDVASGQIGPLLFLAQQNDRGLIRRAGAGTAALARGVLGREHTWRKLAGIALIGLVVLGALGRVDFNVTGSCRLEPSFRRVYAAPFDTTIESAPVRPGDTVAEGQVIVEFDREELELRLREVQSNLASAEKEMSTYLARQEMSKYAEARARREALAAEIELLELHISRAEVRADFPGIVIEGDLTRHIGRPVRMGEQLIEVAPLDTLLLDVEVAQRDVGYVQEGQEGRFST